MADSREMIDDLVGSSLVLCPYSGGCTEVFTNIRIITDTRDFIKDIEFAEVRRPKEIRDGMLVRVRGHDEPLSEDYVDSRATFVLGPGYRKDTGAARYIGHVEQAFIG